MRLAESTIIAGLRDPSIHVREVVAQYLEDCGRTQVDITRQIIATIERFGWEEVFEYPHRIASFELDAATLEWAIGEIERQGEGAPPENMRWHLARMIAKAPIEVVRPQLARILSLDTISERRTRWAKQRWTNADYLEMRNRLFETSPEECWKLLDKHCREIADEKESFAYADALVERIAAGGQLFADDVYEILERREVANSYEEWLTGLAIELAGKLRLESAAELIFQKLEFDFDWYNEAVADALTTIGGPAVTAMVRDWYADSPWHVRLYSTGVFETVHHDAVVHDLLQLTPHEQEDGLRCCLGVALASHFDERGIAPALAIYREDTEDAERFTIIERVFAHARLANLALPELESWEQQIRERSEKFRDSLSRADQIIESILIGDGLIDKEDGRWGTNSLETAWPGTSSHGVKKDESAYKLQPIVRSEPRIGRNERCPCGSGKKYKSCCMRNAPN